jgi:dGTPase
VTARASYTEQECERWRPEPAKATAATRTPFERDRARVLHSSALRRLAAKTQVVGVGEDDFPRTRLTHSLECAQIGRELAGRLGADRDVVDAAGLAHDLGHPPFGHNGETALDLAAADCGGFEGNAQSLRELTRLEIKVPGAGLNLTRATLDATAKYPWPRAQAPAARRPATPILAEDAPGPRTSVKYGVYDDDLDVFTWLREGAPDGRRCLEAQIMDWADDVAYSVHDLEDGVHAGMIDLTALDDPGRRRELVEMTRAAYGPVEGSELEELRRQPWWVEGEIRTPAAVAGLKRMSSELTARFCAAAVDATRAQYGDGALSRYAADLIVPATVRAECALLKGVTALYVMARPGAAELQVRQREAVTELVAGLLAAAPDSLDPELQGAWAGAGDDRARLRVVIDQVARFTDLRAWRRHKTLVG